MTKHHPYGPSAAGRWLACPGSVQLSRGLASTESDYAAEGTLAHELAAKRLLGGGFANDNQEMTDAIQFYVDVVWMLFGLTGPGSFDVELKLESKKIEDFGGTIDVLIVDAKNVYIIDFKYGKGVAVEATDNPQLLSYMILAREVLKLKRGRTYHGIIVQPRTGGRHIKQMIVDDDHLDDFEQMVLDAQSNPNKFKAGEHCRWCPALAVCDTVREHALEVARETFPDDVDDDNRRRWAELMGLKEAIMSLYKKLPGLMLGEMQKGHDIDGYKAVESLGNRAWIEGDHANLCWLLKDEYLLAAEFLAEPKVKTPPQLEKELSKEKFAKIAHLVHRPARGLVLAPSTDPREGVSFQNPVDAFDPIKE